MNRYLISNPNGDTNERGIMAQAVEDKSLIAPRFQGMNYIPPTSRRRLPGRPPYVVTALRRKYAELKGVGDTEGMAHVGATLILFDPSADLAAIPAVRPYTPVRGHWGRCALDILRTANEPMTPTDLAARVMVQQGFDPSDYQMRRGIMIDLVVVLTRLSKDGLVVASGKPRRWAVAR
jgi:hypothetical protein